MCTHGEVIGQVLTRLVADGLAVDQPLQWAKGSTWLLDGANGRLTHARYLQPLVLAPARSMASAPRGPGPCAGCQFSARCLSHRDPRACGCWIDKKLSTRRCRNRGSWVVVAWVAYPSLTVAYQTRSATWIRISLMRETRRYNSRLPMTSRRSSTSSSADAAWR